MKVIKDKKGAGIELAIFMLVVVSAFCTFIISVAYSIVLSKRKEFIEIETRTEFDRLAEDFLSGKELTCPEGYTQTAEEKKLTVFNSDKKAVFVVELDENGKVIRWQYLK